MFRLRIVPAYLPTMLTAKLIYNRMGEKRLADVKVKKKYGKTS